jgi:hypothetical protein
MRLLLERGADAKLTTKGREQRADVRRQASAIATRTRAGRRRTRWKRSRLRSLPGLDIPSDQREGRDRAAWLPALRGADTIAQFLVEQGATSTR